MIAFRVNNTTSARCAYAVTDCVKVVEHAALVRMGHRINQHLGRHASDAPQGDGSVIDRIALTMQVG